jgi:hypothetical protein
MSSVVESGLKRDTGAVAPAAPSYLAPMRALAVAATVLLMLALEWNRSEGYPNTAYTSVILSLGLAHYAASFLYAGKPLSKLGSTTFAWLALVALFVVNMALYFAPGNQETILLVYFGIHHVFNEVYITHRAMGGAFPRLWRLRVAAILLNAALYAAILSHERFIAALVPIEALVGALIVLGVGYAFELRRAWPTLGRGRAADLVSVEVIGLIVAATVLTFDINIRFLDVVFYHFVFWAIYPVAKLAKVAGWQGVRRYGLLNAALMALAFAASPFGIVHYALGPSLFLQAFFFFSFLHISASFAVSDQHPAWIIRLFRPQSSALAAPAGIRS